MCRAARHRVAQRPRMLCLQRNAHLCCVSRLLGGLCGITDRLLSWGALLVVIVIDGFRIMGK